MAKTKPSKQSMNSKKNQSKKLSASPAQGKAKAKAKKPVAIIAKSQPGKGKVSRNAASKGTGKVGVKATTAPNGKKAAMKPIKAAAKKMATVTPIRGKSLAKAAVATLATIAAMAIVKKTTAKSMTKAGAKKSSKGSESNTAKIIALRPQSKNASSKKQSGPMQDMFSPLDDRVLVERLGAAERTAGGLFIPNTVTERPNEGVVLAIGRGGRDKKGRLRPLDVKVGDKVMFTKWAGADCSIGDKELVILHESDIYGVL